MSNFFELAGEKSGGFRDEVCRKPPRIRVNGLTAASFVHHAFALDDGENFIAPFDLYDFRFTVRPFDLQLVNSGRLVQSEMQPLVAGRGIAGAAQYILTLTRRAGGDVNDRA